jgi:phenylpropionate dioxygenase-like ring-hydroxylating dioxygenase large terminal subunit
MATAAPVAPAEGKARGKPTESRGRLSWATWPKYETAVLGLRNYWYPVTWSRKVGREPVSALLCGETLSLVRDSDGLRCVRVGVEEAGGESEVVAYRTYPVAERLGLIWVFVGEVGEGGPPPVESDIPSEILASDAVVRGRLTHRHGNWRFGAENGIDEGHAKFLHRRSLWTLRRQMPTWTRHHLEPTGEGWITRKPDEVHFDTEFPGLGSWPPKRFWRSKGRGVAVVSIRLPCFLRVAYPSAGWQHYEWWIPTDPDHHIYLQMVSKRGSRLKRLRFALFYRLWVRWVFHGMFNDEDRLMVDVMDAPPERLYRPDVAITEWRKLVESDTRGTPQGLTPRFAQWEWDETAAEHAGLPLTHRFRQLIGL